MALSFLAAFLWSVKKGQYADTYTPSVRILLEDKPVKNDDNKEEINLKSINGKTYSRSSINGA